MKKKVMKESTAWQIGAHTVMIIGSLLAIASLYPSGDRVFY
ncbi:MAG: hypothetical protein ACLR2E_11890 [Lachnospiraceae bacterium]